MKRLIVIGASGHGKVVADCGARNGYRDIVFLDDNESLKECGGYPVLGKISEVDRQIGDVIVAIGNAKDRQRIQMQIDRRRLTVLIHPKAILAADAKIGKGSVVMAGAVINPGTVIGDGCIINTACSIDHDCRIKDFTHVSVGACLAGNVTVGEGTWIGIGVTVSNDVTLCGGCFIGAGAVVVGNISEPGTYIGVPAKKRINEDIDSCQQ